ncbi:MAG: metalloregulator ArsR/SmtB family transcription factor [Pseudomonadota bacterium]
MADRKMYGHEDLVEALRAVAEPTRLRIANMLRQAELTVSDLVTILDQSQPRVSRHLKLMSEAGIVSRSREGTRAFYRLTPEARVGVLVEAVFADTDADDAVFATDGESLARIRKNRVLGAERYFAANAERWDEIRSLHLPETAVEQALLELVGETAAGGEATLLDIGTGTGRMLQVLAPVFARATGLDSSAEMLAIARARLEEDGIEAVQLRQGDLFQAAELGPRFDLVVLHMVLHFLEEPGRAIAAAAATMLPEGRLFVVDFEPHDHEFLRAEHNHARAGFGQGEMAQWAQAAGLDIVDYRSLKPVDGPANGLTDGAGAGLVVGIWVFGPQRGGNPWL